MSSDNIRKTRKQEGLCPFCGDVPLPNHTSCEACLLKRQLRRISKKINSKGKCLDCGNPASKTYCTTCTKNKNKYKKIRVENGQCADCGRSREDLNKTRCTDCLNKAKSRRSKLIDEGLCVRCKLPSLTQRCETCTLKSIASRNLGDISRWKEIQDKFILQNMICPYSNRQLTLGVNASLDHIIPKAVGGANHIDNLQWVHISVQIAKFDSSEEEFLMLIKDIATHKLKLKGN